MNLPSDPLIHKAYSQLSAEDRLIFESTYRRKARSVGVAYLWWFLFGAHRGYLGQWGMQFLYWLSGGGVFIWAVVDLFLIPGMVADQNKDVALQALQMVKLHADPQTQFVGVPVLPQAQVAPTALPVPAAAANETA